MSTAYVECPRCGGRALSVATRCPHCGLDFPARPLRRSAGRPDRTGLHRLLAVAGLLALGVLLSVVAVQRKPPATDTPAPATAPADTSPAVMTPAVTPPRPVGAPDSTPAPVPSAPVPSAPVPSAPVPSAPVPSAPPSRAPSPSPRPEAEARAEGLQRYARTWTNVRAGRGNSTPVTRVLQPGAAVLVDSLRRGWYRVLVDDRVVGYVYRTMLELEPAAQQRAR